MISPPIRRAHSIRASPSSLRRDLAVLVADRVANLHDHRPVASLSTKPRISNRNIAPHSPPSLPDHLRPLSSQQPLLVHHAQQTTSLITPAQLLASQPRTTYPSILPGDHPPCQSGPLIPAQDHLGTKKMGPPHPFCCLHHSTTHQSTGPNSNLASPNPLNSEEFITEHLLTPSQNSIAHHSTASRICFSLLAVY